MEPNCTVDDPGMGCVRVGTGAAARDDALLLDWIVTKYDLKRLPMLACSAGNHLEGMTGMLARLIRQARKV